jgi:hypothetical protein
MSSHNVLYQPSLTFTMRMLMPVVAGGTDELGNLGGLGNNVFSPETVERIELAKCDKIFILLHEFVSPTDLLA